ncbi:MAG: hypothetical protein IKN43_07730, partial [Selenomonadaceae bacterium]|nr:hypothetical protein [Selenomonadaceae bacterium]
MECQTLSKCLEEIRAYIDGNMTGFPLLINTQNYEDFNKLRESLESDVTMEKLYVSDMTPEGELPDLGGIYGRDFKKRVCALIGVSQGLMLRGAKALMEELRQLATSSFRGRMIILLSHCESYLRDLINEDGRLPKRILFWQGVASTLPAITVANGNETDKTLYLRGVKGLVYALERYSGIPADKEFIVSTAYSPFAFAHSLYPIKQEATPYERLTQKYPVLAEGDIDEKFGAEADWRWLSEELTKCGTVENLIERYFGDVNSLFWQLSKVLKETDEKKRWLYWLLLKIYTPKGNYFHFALSRGNSLSEFEKEL